MVQLLWNPGAAVTIAWFRWCGHSSGRASRHSMEIVVAFVACASLGWGEQRDSASTVNALCSLKKHGISITYVEILAQKMVPPPTEESPTFDPKSFLETLFKTRQAEIEVIFHHNSSSTNFFNETTESDNDHLDDERRGDFKPDLYFVIGAVSFILVLVIFWATCKAIQMLKISLNDGIDDTVPVPARRSQSDSQNVQSAASGHFLAGM